MQPRWQCRLLIAASAALAATTVALLSGCGGGGIPMATVRGEVKFDGQPVQQGSIAFYPVDGKGPATGAKIEQGEYCTRVPPGTQRVEVRASKVVGKRKPTHDNPVEEDIFQDYIPAIYNTKSTLTREVKMPSTTVNLDLESVPGKAGQ